MKKTFEEAGVLTGEAWDALGKKVEEKRRRRAAEVSACAGFPTEELEKMAADALAILHNPMMIVGRDDDSAKREGFEMGKEAAAEKCFEGKGRKETADLIRALPYPGDVDLTPPEEA